MTEDEKPILRKRGRPSKDQMDPTRKAQMEKKPDIPSEPVIKWKGQSRFRTDLFKGNIQHMLKRLPHVITRKVDNLKTDLWQIEHTHIFHSKDSRGRPQKTTNFVGGHCHQITYKDGPNGPEAVCGPAMHYIDRKTRQGVKRKLVPVVYESFDGEVLPDNHVHKMEYYHSQELQPQQQRTAPTIADELMAQVRDGGYEMQGA